MDTLYRLKRSQVTAAANVLARAFENDPVCIAFFPDATTRVLQNYHLMRHSIRYCMIYGEAYTTSPKLEGISLWQVRDPQEEQAQQSISRRAFEKWINFRWWLGLGKGVERIKALYEPVFTIHDELIPMQHWYCHAIGIAPEFQGQGFGSRLIKPMLVRIDKEQLPCYLDTNNEENVSLYEHFGFNVVKRYVISGSDVINWSMIREIRE